MKELEEMTLEEIKTSKSRAHIEEYFTILSELKNNKISKKIVEIMEGEPINDIYNKILSEEENYRSHSLFPGDLILLYPNIKEQKSRTPKICDFSGAMIQPGSLYINYRPLLDNITTDERFVLKKTIQVETGYLYNLPRGISELEVLETKMLLESPDQEIDYTHLNKQLGGTFIFQKLNKERRRIYDKSRNSK